MLLGADFAFSQVTGVSAEVGAAGGGDDLVGADLLSFSLTDVNFFAGSETSFNISNNKNPIMNTNTTIKLTTTNKSLKLQILSNNNTNTNNYTKITKSLAR